MADSPQPHTRSTPPSLSAPSNPEQLVDATCRAGRTPHIVACVQYPGGRPGQRLAQVEDGEMVLTRKMQEAMGQQGSQTVILRVGSREFGRAVIDSGATDGLQRRRGVGQRRYGG